MNILAVDDEALALEDLEFAIRTALPGCMCACFTDAQAALLFAQGHPVDIAFLDVDMPDINGLVLAKKMKDLWQAANIIFVTGHEEFARAAFNLHASGYLMKPVQPECILEELQNLRHPVDPAAGYRIRVKCFGNFEVFVEGEPIQFARDKSKEVLAYLVDRQGALVTSAEICSVLWEDRKFSRSYISVILTSLIHDLQNAGAGELIIRQRNRIGVNLFCFWCDSYAFMKGDPAVINSYYGEYMSQYSWAERFNADFWRVEKRD